MSQLNGYGSNGGGMPPNFLDYHDRFGRDEHLPGFYRHQLQRRLPQSQQPPLPPPSLFMASSKSMANPLRKSPPELMPSRLSIVSPKSSGSMQISSTNTSPNLKSLPEMMRSTSEKVALPSLAFDPPRMPLFPPPPPLFPPFMKDGQMAVPPPPPFFNPHSMAPSLANGFPHRFDHNAPAFRPRGNTKSENASPEMEKIPLTAQDAIAFSREGDIALKNRLNRKAPTSLDVEKAFFESLRSKSFEDMRMKTNSNQTSASSSKTPSPTLAASQPVDAMNRPSTSSTPVSNVSMASLPISMNTPSTLPEEEEICDMYAACGFCILDSHCFFKHQLRDTSSMAAVANGVSL